jgi:hypothetical protein
VTVRQETEREEGEEREGGQEREQGGDLSRPPSPVPGCPTCTELAIRRDDARAWFNGSAETDTNVLLRRHLRQEHGVRSSAARYLT